MKELNSQRDIMNILMILSNLVELVWIIFIFSALMIQDILCRLVHKKSWFQKMDEHLEEM